jgi:phosphatidylinositol 4-kinase type 2
MFNVPGPLELTRRKKALVWDDELEVPEETFREAMISPAPASPKPSIVSVPLPRKTRSRSSSSEFPPPMRRTSTEAPRPVPFAAKFQRVHPGTTGVTVLEHLERLDAVEASLQRLGGAEEEEVDVGVISTKPVLVPIAQVASSSHIPTSPFSPPGSPLATVHEVSSSASSVAEEDLAVMSKSTSYVEGLPSRNGRQAGGDGRVDWIQPADASQKRTVIVEVSQIHILEDYEKITSGRSEWKS